MEEQYYMTFYNYPIMAYTFYANCDAGNLFERAQRWAGKYQYKHISRLSDGKVFFEDTAPPDCERCDYCKHSLIDNCMVCGAPVCCPRCCKEDNK